MKPAAWSWHGQGPSGACRWWGLWFFWARSNLHFYVYGRVHALHLIAFPQGGGKSKIKKTGLQTAAPRSLDSLPCLALPGLALVVRYPPIPPSQAPALSPPARYKSLPVVSLAFASASASASTLRTVRLYQLCASTSSFSPSALAWVIRHPVPRRQRRSDPRQQPGDLPLLLSSPSHPGRSRLATRANTRASKQRPTFVHLLVRYE